MFGSWGIRIVLVGACLAPVLVVALLGPVSPASSGPADPVIAAAGDIACDPANSNFLGGAGSSNSCHQRATSNLLNGGLAAVLTLGDNQYYCGGYRAWLGSYHGSWGRVKSITRPAVGNHEYLTHGGSSGSTDCTSANAGAAGYFDYFNGIGQLDGPAGGRGSGYYSFDVGYWHLIALNSSCSAAGGCSATSPQGRWLAADLAAHPDQCTLAYWHIPLFSSGGRAASNTLPFWKLLYSTSADVVLTSHDHIYERFAPQRPDGKLDRANGIRQFVVGTGGANHTSLASTKPNSEVRNTDTYGVLLMTLQQTGYTWRFQPEPGKTFTDSGTGACHRTGRGGPPATAPSPPAAKPAPRPVIRLAGNSVGISARRGRVLVKVACPQESCAATAGGRISVRRYRRRFELRPAGARIFAGTEAQLRLRFTRRTRTVVKRALVHHRKMTATVNVKVRFDSGRTAAVRRTIRLR